MREARLIAARIMHDLATPVSAAGMGLSLLEQDLEDQQAFEITLQSVQTLQTTLRLLRALFSMEDPLPWLQMQDILRAYAQNRGIVLAASGKDAIPEYAARILPFLCLVAIEALIGSAHLDLTWTSENITLRARGSYTLSEELLETLGTHHDVHTFSPRSIHVYMLNQELKKDNIQIQRRIYSHGFDFHACPSTLCSRT